VNTRKPAFLAAALAAAIALASPLTARSQSVVDEQQQLLAQIQSDKRAVVLKAMKLDEAQVRAFTPVYDAYQVDRKKLMDRAVSLLNAYASNYDSMTDAAASDILKDWLKLQDDENGLVREYAKKLGKVLPPTRVLRFVQVENKLNTLLRLPAIRAVPLAQ
jgi:hypothetical protein